MRGYRGEIVKTTGDGMLVEFASVVDAVRCSVEIQRGVAERNASVPAEKRIEFRVGINLGDIIHDDNDIFGDGVNVAARLDALAEPGGICVSQTVREAVREKLGFTFEDIGEQPLKNIAVPIRTYRVRFGGDLPAHAAGRRNVGTALAIGLAAACVLGAVALVGSPRPTPAPIAAQPVAAMASTPCHCPTNPRSPCSRSPALAAMRDSSAWPTASPRTS